MKASKGTHQTYVFSSFTKDFSTLMKDTNLKKTESNFHEELKTFLPCARIEDTAARASNMSALPFVFTPKVKSSHLERFTKREKKTATTKNCVFTKCPKVYCSNKWFIYWHSTKSVCSGFCNIFTNSKTLLPGLLHTDHVLYSFLRLFFY